MSGMAAGYYPSPTGFFAHTFLDALGKPWVVAPSVDWTMADATVEPTPPTRETKADRLARWSREALSARKPLYRRPVRLRLPDPVRMVRFRPNRIGRALGEAWRVML